MDKLTNKVISFQKACDISKKSKDSGQLVGFTSGVFDLLHMGHALHLNSIKGIVDILIVGVDDNKTVKSIKGEDRPYYDETERAELLSALEFVDFVFIFKGPCNSKLLSDLNPDYYGVSPHDPVLEYKEEDANIAGTKIFFSPHFLKSYSTSKIGRNIRFEYLLSSSPSLEEKGEGWTKVSRTV